MHTVPFRSHPARAREVLGQAARIGLGAALVTLLGWAAVAAPGCNSHGRYTAEHQSAAKVKMEGLKSATEYKMAEQSFLAGDLEKALKHADYSLALNAEVAKTHVLRGRIMLEMGNLEGAADCLKQAQVVDAKSVQAEYYQGILAERIERYEDALTHFQAAGTLDPSNPQYAIAAAEVMIELGRTAEAETFLSSNASNFDHNAGIRQALGQIAMMQNEPDKAAKLLGEAHLLAPDDQGITEDLIRAQVSTKRFAEAEFNISRLLLNKDNSDRRDLRHVQADCLMLLDRPVEARELLIGLTTDAAGSADVEAWAKLGQIAYLLRDFPRVKQCGSRVIALAPQRADGYVLRALSQRKAGDLAGAKKSIAAALERSRTSDSLVLQGMIQHELSENAGARASFAEAAKLNPTDHNAPALLSLVDKSH